MDLEALIAHRFPEQRVLLAARDTMLYALSVGAGADPARPRDLCLVYEKSLRPLPTLATVLAHPGMWLAHPAFKVDLTKLLHGEQRLDVSHALPFEGEVIAQHAVRAVVDKGESNGALVYVEKRIADAATGRPLCSTMQTLFLRGDGGSGNFGTAPAGLSSAMSGDPDVVDELRTSPSAALLYRLNGDRNPLHVDPDVARAAGFDRPILHGLCVYGTVGYLLTRTVCAYDPRRLVSLAARFTSPVFPGETIRLEGCRDGERVHFQVRVPERNRVVLSNGVARIAADTGIAE